MRRLGEGQGQDHGWVGGVRDGIGVKCCALGARVQLKKGVLMVLCGHTSDTCVLAGGVWMGGG